MPKLALACLAALLAAACTKKEVYNSTRLLRVDQCQDLPPREREECIQKTHETPAEVEDRHKEIEGAL